MSSRLSLLSRGTRSRRPASSLGRASLCPLQRAAESLSAVPVVDMHGMELNPWRGGVMAAQPPPPSPANSGVR
eukprot:8173141-Pyramimonas_sp.AAC.1